MKIRCPLCSKAIDVPQEYPPRPFCSARCKLADLNNWLNGAYRIPAEPGAEEQVEEADYN